MIRVLQKGVSEQIRIQFFFPQRSMLIVIIPIILDSVYSKHFKNTKSRSDPRFSSLREKMLLGILTYNRESINIWRKSKFCNENFA